MTIRRYLALAAALGAAGCDRAPNRPRPPGPADEPTGDTGPTAPEPDRDGDGFADADDCAPDDPEAFPGAVERCNGLDDDCDGEPHPINDRDDDQDGFPGCLECADKDPDAYPGAPDPIDGVDQDCDGTDGVGQPLPPATYLGQSPAGLFGFTLAAADYDGDGCQDLLIGEPTDATVDSVSLRRGCGDGALERYEGEDHSMFIGADLDVAPGLVAVVDLLYSAVGRVLLFDTAFGPDADPILELHSDGGEDVTDSVALLGDPPEWVVTSGYSWGYPQHLNLVSTDRRGVIKFNDEPPDVRVWSDSTFPYSGYFLEDVGDRDGDGAVDLAYGMPDPAIDAVYFFPQVYAAHVDDAPEVWLGALASYTGFGVGGGADVDGDGQVDALVWSAHGDGEQPTAGTVHVVPWRGPGVFSLDDDALVRVEGEHTLDLTGITREASDLDGDGFTDLVVGASGDSAMVYRAGKVMAFAGPLSGVYTADDADLLWVGQALADHAGRGLAVGDFDGSGLGDIAVGAPFASGADEDAGAVYLLVDPL